VRAELDELPVLHDRDRLSRELAGCHALHRAPEAVQVLEERAIALRERVEPGEIDVEAGQTIRGSQYKVQKVESLQTQDKDGRPVDASKVTIEDRAACRATTSSSDAANAASAGWVVTGLGASGPTRLVDTCAVQVAPSPGSNNRLPRRYPDSR